MTAIASPLMPTYPEPPITLVRGEGTRVWDADGNELLDFLTGLAVCSLGHSHPKVAEAVSTQAQTLLHVSNLYGNEIGPQVAATLDRLLGTLGPGPSGPAATEEPQGAGSPEWADGWTSPDGASRGRVFFTSSGTEANECAIKLARKFGGRGRHVVVSALGSFHGRTLAALAATGQPTKHEPFHPMPEGFRHVAWNDLEALEAALDPTVAAVLLEPLQGEGGVNPASAAYFQGVRRLCDERGILLMVDEVQAGLGRTGRWFGHHHFDVVPDVVTMAKALGNGVPVGACWARAEVAEVFVPGDHGSTYGGQPFATAAARAVLAELEAVDAPALAARQGQRLADALADLPGIASVRGLGLLLAAELDPGLVSGDVSRAALAAGLIVNPVTPTALRFAPPLTVSDAEIDQAVAILDKVLTEAMA